MKVCEPRTPDLLVRCPTDFATRPGGTTKGNIMLNYVCVKILYVYTQQAHDVVKIICLKKCEVSVERISVCNVIENLAEHGIHCLQCCYTNDVINMLL